MVRSEDGEAEFPYPGDAVFLGVSEAVSSLPGFKLVKSDRESGVIEGTIGLTFWSAGEEVRISVREAAPGRGKLSLSSASRMKTTVWDQGKNRRNIDEILDATGKILSRASAVPARTPAPPGGERRDAEVREELKPLETLLSQGKISPQEFGNAKARLLAGKDGQPCPSCGASNQTGARECFNCGGPLGLPGAVTSSTRSPGR